MSVLLALVAAAAGVAVVGDAILKSSSLKSSSAPKAKCVDCITMETCYLCSMIAL